MATINKVNAEELRLARKNKFRKKAPKKPKSSSSLHVFENYVRKYNEWCKEVKQRASDERKLEKIKSSVRNS